MTLPSISRKKKIYTLAAIEEGQLGPHFQMRLLEKKRTSLMKKLEMLRREETKIKIQDAYQIINEETHQVNRAELSMVTELPLKA